MNDIKVFWGNVNKLNFSDAIIRSGIDSLPDTFKIDWESALPKQRISFLTKIALSEILAQEYGLPESLHRFQKTENGKPYLEGIDLQFNLSHTKNLFGIAVAQTATVGIDLQLHKSFNPLITERVFCPEEHLAYHASENQERFFFETWSKKEAAVKTTGQGIKIGLKTFSTLEDCATIDATSIHLKSIDLMPSLSAAVGSTLPIDQLEIQKI